ncbi:MAG: hypothetical protein O2971_13215 [Proteobacteria bacterium]|nr:hypothetical protein [Pseudomonadota bacterium]
MSNRRVPIPAPAPKVYKANYPSKMTPEEAEVFKRESRELFLESVKTLNKNVLEGKLTS